MSVVFSGFNLRYTTVEQDPQQIQVWGDDVKLTAYDKLSALVDAKASFHGMKIIGRTEKYYDTEAKDKIDALVIPKIGTGDPANPTFKSGKLYKGLLYINREKAGTVVVRGKFPGEATELKKIGDALVAGSKTVGGKKIKKVTPRINTGVSFDA